MTKSSFLKKIDTFSHGFLKKYKILQKLIYVTITENISSNFRRAARSTVTSEFNTVGSMLFINLGCIFREVLLISVSERKNHWDIRVWGVLDEPFDEFV